MNPPRVRAGSPDNAPAPRIARSSERTAAKRSAHRAPFTAKAREASPVLSLRPHRPLHLRHRADPLVHELLNPLPLVRLRREHVALRVRGDAVHGEELSGLTATVAE